MAKAALCCSLRTASSDDLLDTCWAERWQADAMVSGHSFLMMSQTCCDWHFPVPSVPLANKDRQQGVGLTGEAAPSQPKQRTPAAANILAAAVPLRGIRL